MRVAERGEWAEFFDPEGEYYSIEPGTYSYFNLKMSTIKKMQGCNSTNSKITPCLMNFYDKAFGTDYNDHVKKNLNYTRSILDGFHEVEQLTGCQRPCSMTRYDLNRAVTFQSKYLRVQSASLILNQTGFESSSGIVLLYQQSIINTMEEVPKYTVISAISDVGGILGIFLGFSFWSLHTNIVQPLIRKFLSSLYF